MTKSAPSRFSAAATARRAAPAPVAPAGPRKYTVLLPVATADMFDGDLARVRAAAGRTVNKSDVIRELLTTLHDDPTLLAEVAGRLRAQPEG